MKVLSQVVFVIAVLMLFSGCGKKESGVITGSGTLEATEVLVSAKSGGTLTALLVDEGASVLAGQLIAAIDSEKIVLQQQQALAALEELRLNRINASRLTRTAGENLDNLTRKSQRIAVLLEDGSATQQQFDDLETARKAAEAQFENGRTSLAALDAKEAQLKAQIGLIGSQLRDSRVTAPISGVVIDTYMEAGEVARPLAPVVTLADLTRMYVRIYLKDKDITRIRLNGPAQLTLSGYPGKTFPGRIVWIADKAEFTPKNVQTREARSDLVYAVKVAVDNPDGILKIGMPADVTLL
ncbi:MAG TPA: efflux RND transporter periplasmic adaptor subunit [bacterium]|nr:efflux RND transporter periplasmic adaptor subunit [bacterium]HQG44117.1 efflux RND transporter periplasmic adaptor subunit [bacterium]HQI50396.1 efflux RND transporter periplasmic adaptor subunit [bacterium]HQJ64350.1 efflux RND transporter periplasmic adaptor subunit [bacterium]HQJ65462.1 efflux RND transporter periplasmic adaptor subunit [bacterium]